MPRVIIPERGINSSILVLAPDTVRQYADGEILPFQDMYWGGGEMIYAQAAGTINPFELVQFAPSFDSTNKRWIYSAAAAPVTANQGKPIGVYAGWSAIASGQWGWFQVGGLTPVKSFASIAADTGFSKSGATAGLAVAEAAGTQIVNARIVAPATTTVVLTGYLTNASNVVRVPSGQADGWFPGITVTGTGIPASTTVSKISPDGTQVTLSNPATANGANSLTGTYTTGSVYYNVAHLNRPFSQGRIT